MILNVFAILLFSSGFLLTRQQLETINTPDSNSNNYSRNYTLDSVRNSNISYSSSSSKKVILLLVDALRFDFVDSDPNFHSHYTNKLNFLKSNKNSILLRSFAHPPTTTTQRITAFMTGSLPTFIDFSKNFFSSEISQDNLLLQLLLHNYRTAFVGDDTWVSLFPTVFTTQFPFPSFNVQDLHSVDDGCMLHIRNYSKSAFPDFLVAHFLGVDHVGHSFGPSSLAMSEKLAQFNSWFYILISRFEEITTYLDNNTILFIMGDHGMDIKGDHGGDSVIYMTAKQELKNRGLMDVFSDRVYQIDILPTLSVLLNVPIPFGNLGFVLPSILLSFMDIQTVLEHARINSHQIFNYLKEYSTHSAVDFSLPKLQLLFDEAEASYSKISNNPQSERFEDFVFVFTKYQAFARGSLSSAEKVWARFDLPLILLGSILYIFVICANIWYVVNLNHASNKLLYLKKNIIGGALAVAIGFPFRLVSVLVSFLPSDEVGSVFTVYHEITFLFGIGFCISSISNTWIKNSILPVIHAHNLFAIFLLMAWITVPVSDSYIIHEESILTFILQLFGGYLLIVVLPNSRLRAVIPKIIAFMVLVRVLHISTICRQEKAQTCWPTFNYDASSSVASPYTLISQLFLLGILHGVYKDKIDTRQVIASSLLIWVYWALDTAQGHHLFTQKLLFMRVVKIYYAKIIFPIILLYNGAKLVQRINSDAYEVSVLVLAFLYSFLMFFQKPMGGFMLGVFMVQVSLLQDVFITMQKNESRILFLFTVAVMILGQRLFFCTGHQFTLSSMQWEVSFVGLFEVSWVVSPIFMNLNTFAGPIISSVATILFATKPNGSDKNDMVLVNEYVYLIISLWGFVSTIFVGYFRRHLMVWSVYAPKYMFVDMGLVSVFFWRFIFSSLVSFGKAKEN